MPRTPGSGRAKSKAQRRLMAACSHGAPLDSCPKGMSKKAMREYASTAEAGLLDHMPRKKGKR